MMASPHFRTIIFDALTVTLFEVLLPLLEKSRSVQDVMPLVRDMVSVAGCTALHSRLTLVGASYRYEESEADRSSASVLFSHVIDDERNQPICMGCVAHLVDVTILAVPALSWPFGADRVAVQPG
jgi:hypothetical protein